MPFDRDRALRRAGPLPALVLLVTLLPAAAWASAASDDSGPTAAPDRRDPVLEQGFDLEGGPRGEGEEFRRLTPLTPAEIEAADPQFRKWVELIRTGRADKRVMRLYWFHRSRLDPFDRPVPAGWRQAGLAFLRDAARTRDGARRFNEKRRANLADEDARRGYPLTPPPGSIGQAHDTLRGDAGGTESSVTAGPGLPSSGVWVPVGPFTIPGRMTGLDRPAGDPNTLYASAADGGVWRTTNAGQTWQPLSDFEATLSGGSILLDPNDPNTIYFGTGEGNAAIDNYPGIGVLKSTDGGQTWSESNEFSSVVRRLATHPNDAIRLYAAGDSGCYLSDDAGANFLLISGGGLPDGEGASDVLVRPDDPNVVFCAIWGGINGGIYRSDDRGVNWVELTDGLPGTGAAGRIALAVSRSNPDVMIAGVAQNGGRVYKTTDGGDSWQQVQGTGLGGFCGGQCWYDIHVGVDPVDPSIFYAVGINAFRSTDSGDNWSQISSSSGGRGTPNWVHVDQHFVFTPTAGEAILANDGGIFRSTDHGATWTEWSQGMDTTQYYGICRHASDLEWVFGGTQDNGSHRRRNGNWQRVLGADGGMCMSGPAGSDVIVGEYQNHNMQRSTDDGDNWSDANGGIGTSEPRPWVGLLVADPADRNNMWTTTSRVYRSTDARATNWQAVSNTLYVNRAASALEVAPSDSSVVYVGFDLGGVFVSSNALDPLPPWTDIKQANLPFLRTVRRIRAHPDDADTVYLVYSGFGAGKIWKSTDRGASWTDHTGDLPDVPVNDLLIDADNPGTLLVATDLAVFRSDDDGATWYGFSNGLPTAAAIELTYDRATSKLRLGTHGRSMWEFQSAGPSPIAVPDGDAVPGDPLTVERTGVPNEMRVRWDVTTCTAAEYNLLFGDLVDVDTRSYSGAECSLGTSGVADVPLPSTASGNAFFVVVATDGATTEGPHGFDDQGQPLSANGIGFCGITDQDPLASCP